MADQTRKVSQLWLLRPHGGVLLAVVVGCGSDADVSASLTHHGPRETDWPAHRVPIGHTFRES